MENSSKIRVLYIGPIPAEVGGQSSGGVATLCWGLATQAYKNGYEVYIGTEVNSSYNKNGVEVISLPSGSKLKKAAYALCFYVTNRKKLKGLDFLTWREKVEVLYKAYLLKGILKSVKPDLIHVLRMLENAIFSLNIINDCPPIVVTDNGIGTVYEYSFHELYKIKRKVLLLNRIKQILKAASCIISVSQFSKSSLLNTLSLSSSLKVKSVLNPVSTDKWQFLDREWAKRVTGLDDKKVILFCAVHFPIEIKGLDILLKTIASDKNLSRSYNVLIITNEEVKVYTQNFIKANNIERVTILGPQTWDELVKYYNAADIFVMPSKLEGIATVYYESLLAGVPVIGFSRNIEELEKVLGIYVGEKFDAYKEDEKSLAEKIQRVLNTDFNRLLLRKKVLENLSWDTKFHEFDSIYRDIMSIGLNPNPKMGTG